MIDNPATSITYDGITHTCLDPNCHVRGFVQTLADHHAVEVLIEQTPALHIVRNDD